MIFGRKLPAPVARLCGHPIDFALLDDGAWIVPVADRLVYAPTEAMPDEQGGAGATEEPVTYEWFDFEGASWNEGARTITFAFVDGRPEWTITFAEGEKQKISWVIRERLDRSIFYQEHAELPSGARARGLVRRARDESLFTQVIIDGRSGPADAERIEELGASLRDVTGISD